MSYAPFDDNDKVALLKARAQLGAALELLNKAMACGRDCTEKEMRRQELDNILQAYQQHFFPDGSSPTQ